MSKTIEKLTARLRRGRGRSLADYRRFVASLAQGRPVKAADETALAEVLGTLGIGPEQVEADVAALKKHAELTRLAQADDAEDLGRQAAEARRQAEEHRTAARKAEQAALAADAQLRAHAHRRHELRELERRNPRLFGDSEAALGAPPKPEDSERPPTRPENVTPQQLQLAQAVERIGFPPPVGARP